MLTPVCTGFVPNRSIITNCNFHLNKEKIVNIDISDFFPSINRQQIFNLFKYKLNYNDVDSYYLSYLVTHNECLPQGASTSPMLANYIARYVDIRIVSYLKKMGSDLSYSRYADDLTIGMSGDINPHKIIDFVYDVLEGEGFYPNINKTKVLGSGSRQEITGLIINSGKPSVGKKKLDRFRAIFYSIEKYGRKKSLNIRNKKTEQFSSIENFRSHLYGWLSFIKPIHPEYYIKYISLFSN